MIEVKNGRVSVNVNQTLNVEDLTKLIEELGNARAQIAEDPDRPQEGTAYQTVFEPRLWTFWGPQTEGNFMLMTKHPQFGWRGVMMTPRTASEISIYLSQYLASRIAATSQSTTAPAATQATPPKGEVPQGGTGGNVLH
ncbi:hypothetical protein [Paracidovorax avenae]|uniref:hypothetical protein n=1 Tax=Paracidovorax avenae TaxID=80867 RepID=UPI000A676832|nr:hypothetical protein [Paracidovorax avenae]